MKKIIAIIISIVLTAVCLSACGTGSEQGTEAEGKLKIVTDIYAVYDWTNRIMGDESENGVILLTDNGTDLHSYQPSAEDILDLTTCDVLIYVGGQSDAFIDDALKNSMNDDMKVVNMIDILGDSVREETLTEGMEAEEEEEDEVEYDEHVWLSLRNAEVICDSICEALIQADPENEELYRKNLEEYESELSALDAEFAEAVSEAGSRTLIFGDRFPFRYLTDDYGLEYFAAFPGCSADTDASFETVTTLAHKADEYEVPAILIIEGSDGKIAETVINSTENKDQKILTLNSMQSVNLSDLGQDDSYLSFMKENLDVIIEALG